MYFFFLFFFFWVADGGEVLPDNKEVRLISIPVIDCAGLSPPELGALTHCGVDRGGKHCKPPASLQRNGGIYRRNRDGRGAARHGGPSTGERLRVPRNHVAGAADTHRRFCSAVSRGIWEVPETADRADMDPGAVYWIQPVL